MYPSYSGSECYNLITLFPVEIFLSGIFEADSECRNHYQWSCLDSDFVTQFLGPVIRHMTFLYHFITCLKTFLRTFFNLILQFQFYLFYSNFQILYMYRYYFSISIQFFCPCFFMVKSWVDCQHVSKLFILTLFGTFRYFFSVLPSQGAITETITLTQF